MSSQLYQLSADTEKVLNKFRLATSNPKDPLAVIYTIDKKTLEIRQAVDQDYEVFQDAKGKWWYYSYKGLKEYLEEAGTTPCFILLGYPLELEDGRKVAKYAMLYYMPRACNEQSKMLYAGALEFFRRKASAQRNFEITSVEELDEDIPEKIRDWAST